MTLEEEYQLIKDGMNKLCEVAYRNSRNAGWYTNLKTGEPLERNVGEMIALCHSEFSEMLEGHRKGLQDDHLPHIKMFDAEGADVAIRLGDLCGFKEVKLGDVIVEKMLYNLNRADHKIENRLKDGGKKI